MSETCALVNRAFALQNVCLQCADRFLFALSVILIADNLIFRDEYNEPRTEIAARNFLTGLGYTCL